MANLNGGFDANQVDPDAGRRVIPKGDYVAMIVESDLKPNSAGTGTIIPLTFKITEGEFKGVQVYANINYSNPNEQAQNIGHGQFSAICHAVNILKPQATEQLHNIPLLITVKVSPARGEYDERNEITAYRKCSAASSTVAAPAFNMPPAAAPAFNMPPAAAPAFNMPPAAAPAAEPVLTAKAAGATYKQMIAAGWTDALMFEHGYLEKLSPISPAMPVAPAVLGGAPPAQAWGQPQETPAAEFNPAEMPAWMRQQQ